MFNISRTLVQQKIYRINSETCKRRRIQKKFKFKNENKYAYIHLKSFNILWFHLVIAAN